VEPEAPDGHLTRVPNNRIHPARVRFLSLVLALTVAVGISAPAKAQVIPADLQADLSALAPALDPNVLGLALAARGEALEQGLLQNTNVLTVIDYSRASIEPRFWVFDLASKKLLFEELVAHGKNSGENFATHFSNEESSLESSYGMYVTGGVYVGKHGRSLRLEGQDPGYNDRALARGIVIHAADYVSPAVAAKGRLGRSWGCPALSPAVTARVIDTIRDGSALFAYYPDSSWIQSSAFLKDAAAEEDTLIAPTPQDETFAVDATATGFRARLALFNATLIEWASSFADRVIPMA
jgi:hypothetical protein